MKNRFFLATFFGIIGFYLFLSNFFVLFFVFGKNLAKAAPQSLYNLAVAKVSNADSMQAQASSAVLQFKDKIIPQEGSKSVDDITFSNKGYEKLLEYQKNIKLGEDQKEKFINFDVFIPCCGFEKTIWPEEKNCACGHHLALYGLIKYMIEKGYDRPQIQQEVDRWKYYFFPDDYLRDELKNRNLLNSMTEKALQEMQAKGSC